MPEFCPKITEFYVIIVRKVFTNMGGERGHVPPACLSSPAPMRAKPLKAILSLLINDTGCLQIQLNTISRIAFRQIPREFRGHKWAPKISSCSSQQLTVSAICGLECKFKPRDYNWSPRPAIVNNWLCLSVCPSGCLSVCHTPSNYFFLFLDGIEPFLAVISPCVPLQNCFLRFLI